MGELPFVIFIVLGIIFLIFLFFYLCFLPLTIADRHNLSKDKKMIILILVILTFVFGFTWFIALFLSWWWKDSPQSIVNGSAVSSWLTGETKQNIPAPDERDVLEKYYQLKEQGIISEKEYMAERSRILG